MGLTYEKRNLATIDTLAPNTRAAALKLHDYAVKNNIDILIYEGIRTLEQQKQNVARGASQTLKSYHIVGQAIDFVPVKNAKAVWDGYGSADVLKFVAEAKRLGFEWGGDWKDFVDKPHLQFNYKGYGTDKVLDVQKPSNDYGSFEKEIELVKSLGIMSGYSESAFKPNETVTRGQLARTIANLVTYIDGKVN